MRAKEPVQRLKKIGISVKTAEYIASKGISSAIQLANMTTAELKKLFHDANMDTKTIADIKKRAALMKALVDNHLATIRGMLSPSYKALASTNPNNSIINFHEGMESYTEMFGNDNYQASAEFDSMLSPAAYLVDLMRYIREYIQQPQNGKDTALLLQSRRPDIWKIPLTTDNTLDEVPYLELVNEILKTKLDAEGKIDADGTINSEDKIGNALRYMAETIYPFNLPFNAPLEQIRKYLEALQSSLYEVYKTFSLDADAAAREYLGLSPEQVSYLTTPLANNSSLNLAYGNIVTANPKPHFKGIDPSGKPGTLSNAEIFMNQVGLTETSALKALFYQGINLTIPGAPTLLNRLFINKSCPGQHLAYNNSVTGSDWSGENVWKDQSYYSTIQRVMVDDELYMIVRTMQGIDTWKYDDSFNTWKKLLSGSPAWSDQAGWTKPQYYSTIQAIAVKSQNPLEKDSLYLLGRNQSGMHICRYDTVNNKWDEKELLIDLSGNGVWDKPENYRTLKTISVFKFIFLIGRDANKLNTWYFDTSANHWTTLLGEAPPWSDAAGWNKPECYLTIKMTTVDNINLKTKIVLTGRSNQGVVTYLLDFSAGLPTLWFGLSNELDPEWDDNSGWNQPNYYSTIQSFQVEGLPYLLAYGPNGITIYNCLIVKSIFELWLPCLQVNSIPDWNDSDWQDPSNYLTLKAVVSGTIIILSGRSPKGIQTWEFDTSNFRWTHTVTNMPPWNNLAGWSDPAYYTTINVQSSDTGTLLSACTSSSIETWRYSNAIHEWVKDVAVKAVIELQNESGSSPVTMPVLDLLNRFIRLAAILDWKPEDLDWALLAAGKDDIKEDAIGELKNLKWIMDTLNISLWQATAFLHDLKTWGEGDGPVSLAPFDRVFNRPIPFVRKDNSSSSDSSSFKESYLKLYHPVYPLNPNYRDNAVIWQTDGKSASTHSIMLRLMGSLNLDARNLMALADYFKGTSVYISPNEIQLNVENLSILYRFSLLANKLKLSAPELIVLLDLLGLTNIYLFSSDQVIRIITHHQWMTENKLNVYRLNYIINSFTSKFIDTGFDLAKVPPLLKSLSEASAEWYLNIKQVQVDDLMTDAMSRSFYNTLSYKKFIDDRGIILKNEFSFGDVSDWFTCEEISFAVPNQLLSVCAVGKEPNLTASQILIPFNPNAVVPPQQAWDGSLSLWFRYDGVQQNSCTLYSLYTIAKKQPVYINQVGINKGELILISQNQQPVSLYKLPSADQWHLLVISYKEQSVSIDTLSAITNLAGLKIPENLVCAVAIGDSTDSFRAAIAELRIFDSTLAAKDIVSELYPAVKHPSDPLKGNTNYWPLDEGQGYETAKDIVGDLNGVYAGNNQWHIIFNTIIAGFNYLNAKGNLTVEFDPVTDNPSEKHFVQLWKMIASLRNILNKTIDVQKQGTAQKLADYYQVNKDVTLYADYVAKKDKFPYYIQTLLTYRLSLSWLEFSLDLDRGAPFISTYLRDQFNANKISLSENAIIIRLTDKDGHPTGKWLIGESDSRIFFLNRRDDALDIYKLLPAEYTAIYSDDDSFITDIKYSKFKIDKEYKKHKPTFYFSHTDGQFAVVIKKGRYVCITLHESPGTPGDVVSQINSFVSDLGQLLFTVKALNLRDDEFSCLIDNPERFFVPGPVTNGPFNLLQLKAILLFKRLNTIYSEEGKSFTDYFYMPDDMGTLVSYVSKLTQWDAQGLRQLSEWKCLYELYLSAFIPNTNSGSVISVGANSNYAISGNPSSNAVFVYQLTGEKWEELPAIKAPAGSLAFGTTVAIQKITDGDSSKLFAFVADPSYNKAQGIVYVFGYNDEKKGWNDSVPLQSADGQAGDCFGSAISVYHDTIAIGATKAGSTHSGNVYLFQYASDKWIELPVSFTLQPADSLFGSSVSLYEDILAVGSANNAYIFRINNNTASSLILPVACNAAKVVTNGDFVVMAGLVAGKPVIYYITNTGRSDQSQIQTLQNYDISGACTIAIAGDTLIINDSANTCFVYYIQDTILSFRNSFTLTASSEGAKPIALSDGNLMIASNDTTQSILLFFGTKHDIGWFGFADNCFQLAGKLGLSIGSLLGFISLSGLQLTLRTTSDTILPDPGTDNYKAYEDYADKLSGALSMGHSGDDWDRVYFPLRDQLLEKKRNALAGYMIFSLQNSFTDIQTINDLYELLLIDVGSAGSRIISKIKAALNSLQLYIERSRMQLEPYVTLEGSSEGSGDTLNAADVEWNWMSHYRKWEANRQVFLFPENYYDPTLRKDESNEYANLQNKLCQSNLTNDNAIDAFQSYFNELEGLTGLSIVAVCTGNNYSFVNGSIIIKNTCFIFAKTKNRDEGFYYRTADAILPSDTPDTWMNWTNWQKINVSIKADMVTPVYANGKVFLFWLEFVKQQVSGFGTSYDSTRTYNYETKVYYTFLKTNGQWSNPHEVPGSGSSFNFTVSPTPGNAAVEVTLPPAPQIGFYDYPANYFHFLNVADLSIIVTAKNGKVTPTKTLDIDEILSVYKRYMWTLNGSLTDLRSIHNLAGQLPTGVTWAPESYLFNGSVISLNSLYAGGLQLPVTFKTWFNDSFTFGTWINGQYNWKSIMSFAWPILYPTTQSPASNQFNFQIQDSRVFFGLGESGFYSKTVLLNYEWYFVVFQYDAKTGVQSIFLNGVLDNREYISSTPSGSATFALGFTEADMLRQPGLFAQIFTVNAVIADSEILAMYNQYIRRRISDASENYEWELSSGFHDAKNKEGDALLPSTPGIGFADSGGWGGKQSVLLNSISQEYLSVPLKFAGFFAHSFSICIWINGSFPSNGDWPILGSSKISADELFCLLVRNGTAFFGMGSNSLAGQKKLGAAWNSLIFTYDEESATQTIYVNGSYDISLTGVSAYAGSSIGMLGAFDNNYANGFMFDLVFVNRALSAQEVQHITNNALPPDPIPLLNSMQHDSSVRIQQFSENLFTGGADYLYGKNSLGITASSLSSKAPYGKYVWELFYHIPMLIAQSLCSNQKFEDAKRWYEYIFNPTTADNSSDRYWRLGYFRSLGKPEGIVETLTDNSQKDTEQILLYDIDPFDPEAIAYLRPGAFEKKAVINYIKNLIAWGDNLFSQYTWETITQAEMLYVLAKELLGKAPEVSGSFGEKTPMTIERIEEEYPDGIPQFMIDIEDMQAPIHPHAQFTSRLSASVSNFYFGIPDNDELNNYRQLVKTRLYEIRNGLNILGQKQSLLLFEPPINPMLLVAAAAAGLNPADVPISYAADIPHYRFTKMIDYAKAVTQRVIDYGSEILSALEKKDAESLAVLNAVHERTILVMTVSMKEKAIEEAINQGLALDESLNSANDRVTYYQNMLAKPISDLESAALDLNQIAIECEIPATELHVAAVIGHLIPTVFGFADGDFSPGGAIDSSAAALSTGSNIANNQANMTVVSASYNRRSEDWGLQLKLAEHDVNSIKIQKVINNINLQTVTRDLEIQNQTIANNQTLQDFYKGKFTNRELYQWMIDQTSSVYYQGFQMALDLAKKAQTAYQFELNSSQNIISYGYWDNTRRGLLCGEKLMSDLDRLEKTYVDNNQRYLEIQKVISLKDLSLTELHNLITKGSCRIRLTEQMFDRDFPGHYNRKIKSVSITIPAIVGPYQSIKASLLQSSNKVVTQPDLGTVKFLVSQDHPQAPPGNLLRTNWRPNQQIAISKASGDNGMFEFNFSDDRYLPFEGTGVVSDWELSIPQANNAFDLSAISDVILYINYTAQDGGAEFTEQVMNLPEIKDYHGLLTVSMRQQFNQAWNTFITKGSAHFSPVGLHFPPNLKQPVTIDKNHVVKIYRTNNGHGKTIVVDLKMEDGDWEINCDADTNLAALTDMIIEIPYSGELN